jgi:hypothetical protein
MPQLFHNAKPVFYHNLESETRRGWATDKGEIQEDTRKRKKERKKERRKEVLCRPPT